MPELHKNQIEWNAPEPQKVSLAKPDDSYLVDSLNYLANVSDNISRAQQKYDDDALAKDLNEQINLANREIDDARSVDADFDSLGEKALSRIQATIGKYDQATQNRFMRDQPHYLDNMQLAISEKILARKRDIFETDVETNLPLWTSQAVLEGTPQARQEVIHKIQDRLGNISLESTVSKFIFKANQLMDEATIANLLIKGTEDSLNQAEAFLKTPEVSSTIDAYKRASLTKQLKESREQLAKLKKTADDPLSDELVGVYATLSRLGYTTYKDDVYKQVVNTNNPIIAIPSEAWGLKDENGNTVPQFIDISSLTSMQRAKLGLEMNKYKNLDPNAALMEARYANAIADADAEYTIASENHTSKQGEAVALIENLMSDTTMFNTLPNGTKQRMADIRDKYYDAGEEALAGHKTFIDTAPFAAASVGVPVQNVGTMIARGQSPEVNQAKGIVKALSDLDSLNFWGTPSDMVNTLVKEQVIPAEKTYMGEQLRLAAKELKANNYSDIEDNTVGDYGILVAATLEGMNRTGQLKNTRFAREGNGKYFKPLDNWMSLMRVSGVANSLITKDNTDNVDYLFDAILNDDNRKNRTQQELDIINTVKRNAKTGQAPDNANVLEQAVLTPSTPTTYKPEKSNPTPAWNVWQRFNTLYNTSSKGKNVLKADKAVK